MSVSQRLLASDERVVVHTRTHGKALIGPAVLLIGLGALTGAGAAIVPSSARPYAQYAVAALGVGLAIWWSLLPFLRWRTTTYTITNHRVLTRRGILNRTGTDLPLRRINDVGYERSLSDRILGRSGLDDQGAAAQDAVPWSSRPLRPNPTSTRRSCWTTSLASNWCTAT